MNHGSSTPPRVRDVLPGLSGRGVVLAAAKDGTRVRQALHDAGYAVTLADLTAAGDLTPGTPERADTLEVDRTPTSLRTAQAAIARALRLPETAGRNLDALVDSLRDLATWWPEDERVALVLAGAESLVDSDLPGWHTLTEILGAASQDLWRGGEPGDRVFETIALIEHHGVLALPAVEDEEPA